MQPGRGCKQHCRRLLSNHFNCKLAASVLFCLAATASWAVTNTFNIVVGTTFTPLHTYFMAATGCSDANNGTSTSTPWCTPNHALVCGDVILANAGAYSANFWSFGVVSSCPSSSGGIDGAGGIYFATLLCAGVDLEACPTSSPNPGNSAFTIGNNNWSIQGFKVSNPASRAFECYAAFSGTAIVHHIAFVNDIAANTASGYDTNDGALNHNIPGNGCDYFAVVGSVAQNAAQDGICLAAIDVAGPANFDLTAGTHAYIYGNFAWANRVACGSDGEAIMFDTFDAHNYRGTATIFNNIAWDSERFNIQIFYQAINAGSTATIMHVFNNTLFWSNAGINGVGTVGGINIQSNAATLPYLIAAQNNISLERFATQGNSGSGPVYAFLIGGNYGLTIGGTGSENIFKGQQTTCSAACDPGNNVVAFNGGSFGTNTYVNPSFSDTTDLINNRSGIPTCTGFKNVTQCMGYDALTRVLTIPSIISDFVAGCAQCAGKGYQLPGNCQPVADYPTWLKGIVYLTASGWTNGATVTENAGLVTKPCNM